MHEKYEADYQLNPGWDYYLTWHQLAKVRSDLDDAMSVINRQNCSFDIDFLLVQTILDVKRGLESIKVKHDVISAVKEEEEEDKPEPETCPECNGRGYNWDDCLADTEFEGKAHCQTCDGAGVI